MTQLDCNTMSCAVFLFTADRRDFQSATPQKMAVNSNCGDYIRSSRLVLGFCQKLVLDNFPTDVPSKASQKSLHFPRINRTIIDRIDLYKGPALGV